MGDVLVVVICVPGRGTKVVEADFEFVTTTLVYLGNCCVRFERDMILGQGFMVLRLMKTTLLGLLPDNC